MAEDHGPTPAEGAGQPSVQGVTLQLEPAEELDYIIHANHLFVQFNGVEFFVAVVATAPAPVFAPPEAGAQPTGKILARYSFSALEWMATIKNLSDHLQTLKGENAFRLLSSEAVESLLG